ncbi:uncharacterized protein LOC126562537 [Anopheles maculipalpis]|uniref:uncharacterized protein LOC126562537 n=1 Tax=Anopheles maculipalpis TaxID=1496333 RepID=UPI002158F224|nr:uncharacterized protein LOC126562537 [Anopheles maculipalpis]
MVNLCSLLLKYNNFSQVEDDIFVYIDRILENAFEIHKRQTEAKKELACMEEEIAQKQKRLPTSNALDLRSPIKKRKVHSLDSSLSACKENVSMLEDSTIFPHKSDSDVSSKLEQNILDSDEPFFALTQTPPSPAVPPLREIVSPRNESCSKTAIRAAKLLFAEEIKSPKQIIRESRFGKHFKDLKVSPVATEDKPVAPATTSVTPNGKWTGKKCKEKMNSPNAEVTPVGLKRFHSLADSSSRFHQAKLNFVRQPKHSPGNSELEHAGDDTLFSDFVIPTPPSVASKSKFLKSLRMKKQSPMLLKGQSDTAGTKERCSGAAVSSTNAGEQSGTVPASVLQNDEGLDDINQTYCPGVESINRITTDVSVKIKQEPASQREKRQQLNFPTTKQSDCVTNLQQIDNRDSETDEVILLPSACLQSVVSVVDSPNDHDNFVFELNNEKTKREYDLGCLANDHGWSNNLQRNHSEFGGPSGAINPFNRSFGHLREGLCNDCMKLYKFHAARGVSNDAARSKLPRNCRTCRLAQLHSTPPGFWDPDFLPTPE